MAIGTAITVAMLATLALGSREIALRLGGRSGAFANAVWTTCSLGGSALILLFGATLFAASLGPARPFRRPSQPFLISLNAGAHAHPRLQSTPGWE